MRVVIGERASAGVALMNSGSGMELHCRSNRRSAVVRTPDTDAAGGRPFEGIAARSGCCLGPGLRYFQMLQGIHA